LTGVALPPEASPAGAVGRAAGDGGRSFHRVCTLDDLWAGEMAEYEVAGVKVLVVHTEDGRVTAIQPMCPHQEVPLAEGTLEGSVVTCRMHLWQVDAVTGKGINPEHAEVAIYPTRVTDGTVFVAVDGVQTRYSRP